MKCMNSNRIKIPIRMCKTQWSVRDIGYGNFCLGLPFIMEVLKIVNGNHSDIESFEKRYTDGW